MANLVLSKKTLIQFLLLCLMINVVFGGRMLRRSSQEEQDMLFQYHNGPLLTGDISINLIWYGDFKPTQKAVICDFITSLAITQSQVPPPAVAAWTKNLHNYYNLIKSKNLPQFSLGSQVDDEECSFGKSLEIQQIEQLAAKGSDQINSINVVLTSSNVTVEGFCSSKCGTHSVISSNTNGNKVNYIWVGNSDVQCPGQCAWPFHQPIYGPQNAPLVAPNNDVGIDGMIINFAGLLAGTATNPFGNGFYQGPATAPLEAASACPGIYGKGAYPGYAGNLLVDPSTGASYNAAGDNGRKFLLPALYDPTANSCNTLV